MANCVFVVIDIFRRCSLFFFKFRATRCDQNLSISNLIPFQIKSEVRSDCTGCAFFLTRTEAKMTDHNRDLSQNTSEFKNSQKPVQKSTKNDQKPQKRHVLNTVLYRIFHEPYDISKIIICRYMYG